MAPLCPDAGCWKGFDHLGRPVYGDAEPMHAVITGEGVKTMGERPARDKRFTISVTPDAYDVIKHAAQDAGLSVSAWSAITLTQTANHATRSYEALLEAAKQSIRELIGQQDVLPLLLEAQRKLQEEDGGECAP